MSTRKKGSIKWLLNTATLHSSSAGFDPQEHPPRIIQKSIYSNSHSIFQINFSSISGRFSSKFCWISFINFDPSLLQFRSISDPILFNFPPIYLINFQANFIQILTNFWSISHQFLVDFHPNFVEFLTQVCCNFRPNLFNQFSS